VSYPVTAIHVGIRDFISVTFSRTYQFPAVVLTFMEVNAIHAKRRILSKTVPSAMLMDGS